jgi:DNA-binding beta-propeller fold protein YncE
MRQPLRSRPTYAKVMLALVACLALLLAAGPVQAAPFVYATNSASGSVSQYEAAGGGLLTPLTPPEIAAPSGAAAVAASPDARSLYVASLRSGVVAQYDIQVGGTLTPKAPASIAVTRPGDAIVSPDGRSAYVVTIEDSSVDGAVNQYDVGVDGKLTPKTPPSVPTCQGVGLAITPAGDNLYVACGDDEAIFAYDVATDGTLSESSPRGIDTNRTPVGLAVSPDGRSLYSAGFGGAVEQFDIAGDGTLSFKDPPEVDAESLTRDIAVSPDGRSVYALNGGNDLVGIPATISQYDVRLDGTLVPKVPATVAAATLGAPLARALAVAADGRNLYVTNPSADLIRQYDVAADGSLTPKSPATVAAGDSPAGIAVTPMPTNKQQCKRGNWRFYGFTNQGRCIRFVTGISRRDRNGRQASTASSRGSRGHAVATR